MMLRIKCEIKSGAGLPRFNQFKRLLIDPAFFGKGSRPFGWGDFVSFVPAGFLTPVQVFAHGCANVRGGPFGEECLRKANRVGPDASAVYDRVKQRGVAAETRRINAGPGVGIGSLLQQ